MSDTTEQVRDALAGRYVVERDLGSGGMATVYLAEDLRHHRKVAVKVLRPELALELGPDRFLREIEVTANLAHPNIVPLYDSGAADGLLFYVMPYVDGESLRHRLDRERQLPIEDALQITGEVADALDHAHRHGVIHRDIKPENILFEGGHAVITDFGLAWAIDAASSEERLTRSGLAVGTPEYMSPEQTTGSDALDGRSDLYSLGCVLHEMLAGQPPFTGPSASSVVRQHVIAEPPDVRAIRAGVPNQVGEALDRCLAKSPADRFSLAGELRDAIAQIDPRVGGTGGSRWRALGLGMAAAILVILIGAALLMPRNGQTLDPDRILVVAFEDAGGAGESPALGRMAQDYVIQTLSEAGFAEVVDPLTALAAWQNVAAAGVATGPAGLLALAHDAAAGTVVSGTYYAEGDSFHIQTRISDARDGRLLGTVGPIVGSAGAPAELVARLGQEVVAVLAPLLDRDLGGWEPAVRPATYEAYEAYAQGLEAWQGVPDSAPVAEAGRHFERAAAADPTFTRAALWAALIYQLNGPAAKADSLIAMLVAAEDRLSRFERCRLDFVRSVWGPHGNLTAAYEATRCTVQAAPGSDDARRELAILALRLNRPGETVRLLQGLDPDRGLIRRWSGYWDYLAHAYHVLGDHERELAVAREGQQRFPDGLRPLWTEVYALVGLGRVDEVRQRVTAIPSYGFVYGILTAALELRAHGHRAAAREVFDHAIRMSASQPQDAQQARVGLVQLLYNAERWDDARRVCEAAAEAFPDNGSFSGCLALLAARRGDRETALNLIATAQAPLIHAKVAALLGDREDAMTFLRQAIDWGFYAGYAVFLHVDIDFESLHDYPPFQELMRPKG